MQAKPYTGHLGPMDFEHKNPPAPFNPKADPKAEARYAAVTASMQADGRYENFTREENRVEWRARYDALAEKDAADA